MPTTVPARHGKALRVDRAQTIVLVNPGGHQVVDTWAFNAEDPGEYMCMAHTRSLNSQIYPKKGDRLFTSRRRPALLITEDTSPGVHDTLLCACSREIYEELGCTTYHRNCEDNLHEALAELGLAVPFTPAPLNLFMNTPALEGGGIERRAPVAQPGDRLALHALMDLVVVFSACPQDLTIINGEGRQPREVVVEIT